MQPFIFVAILIITVFVIAYRKNSGENVYKYIMTQTTTVYNKYAPYSYAQVAEKAKELGREYTLSQYTVSSVLFMAGGFLISYLYFYNILVSILYAFVALLFVPYMAYLKYKKLYSEFIFEQIQTYTTNTIMEFATTQSFVKSLEGVYESGVLEDPILSDVKVMIDMAYQNGTIFQSIDYFNAKYPFYIVRNMHQLFTQITTEGSLSTAESFENMLVDIDMLVESVYRDRLDREAFHKKFIQFGMVLYFMVMLVQIMVSVPSYIKALDNIYLQLLLHAIVLVNSYFLLMGIKYYNENVGAE